MIYLALVPSILLMISNLTRCQSLTQANEVSRVDLRRNDNIPRHHTGHYKQMDYVTPHNPIGRSIVLRRGEMFNIIIHLKQPYNRTEDKIRLEFSFGAQPQLDKGTLIYLPLATNLRGKHMGCEHHASNWIVSERSD